MSRKYTQKEPSKSMKGPFWLINGQKESVTPANNLNPCEA